MVKQLAVLLGWSAALAPPAWAQAPVSAGRVIAVQGHATLLRDKNPAVAVHHGDALLTGDALITERDGSLRLLMADDSVLDLAAGTTMKLDVFNYSGRERSRTARITMWLGRMWARVSPTMGDDANFHVSTPNAVAGVRGTSLIIDVAPGDGTPGAAQTRVTVVNGRVQVRDALGGEQNLLSLMQSTVTKGGQTVNPHVEPQTLGALKTSVTVKSGLPQGNAQGRLQTLAGSLPGGVAANTASSAPKPPPTRDISTGTPPPLDIDPTKNTARLNVHVTVKE